MSRRLPSVGSGRVGSLVGPHIGGSRRATRTTSDAASVRFVKVSHGELRTRHLVHHSYGQQRTAAGPGHRSPNSSWKFASDVVPDIVRPALEHASPRHDVQTVASRVSVRPEQRRSVDGKEVDVGVFPRLEDRLQGYQ